MVTLLLVIGGAIILNWIYVVSYKIKYYETVLLLQGKDISDVQNTNILKILKGE